MTAIESQHPRMEWENYLSGGKAFMAWRKLHNLI